MHERKYLKHLGLAANQWKGELGVLFGDSDMVFLLTVQSIS
jgi:hypothetical protein